MERPVGAEGTHDERKEYVMASHQGSGIRRRVAPLMVAVAAAALTSAVGTGTAHATAQCDEAMTDLHKNGSTVYAEGECTEEYSGSLWVTLYRNGTVVFSGGNG